MRANQGVQRTGGQRCVVARWFNQKLVVSLPPPLSFRVAMTSVVKRLAQDARRGASWGCLGVSLATRSGGACQRRRGSRRISGGGLPPDVWPSSAGRGLGARGGCRLVMRTRVTPHRGGASSPRHRPLGGPLPDGTSARGCGGGQGPRLGNSPPAGHPGACDGPHDLSGVLTARRPVSGALTPPPWGSPAAILAGLGARFQA
jgi:hypothetical protein